MEGEVYGKFACTLSPILRRVGGAHRIHIRHDRNDHKLQNHSLINVVDVIFPVENILEQNSVNINRQ